MKREDRRIPGKNIYVGETSRSLYERTKEHIRDGKNRAPDSHIAKHWDEHHKEESMPHFRFKIVKKFQDFYTDSITIVMVNNKLGRVIQDRRGSLRQGGCA